MKPCKSVLLIIKKKLKKIYKLRAPYLSYLFEFFIFHSFIYIFKYLYNLSKNLKRNSLNLIITSHLYYIKIISTYIKKTYLQSHSHFLNIHSIYQKL